jgi:hypothetical protein
MQRTCGEHAESMQGNLGNMQGSLSTDVHLLLRDGLLPLCRFQCHRRRLRVCRGLSSSCPITTPSVPPGILLYTAPATWHPPIHTAPATWHPSIHRTCHLASSYKPHLSPGILLYIHLASFYIPHLPPGIRQRERAHSRGGA